MTRHGAVELNTRDMRANNTKLPPSTAAATTNLERTNARRTPLILLAIYGVVWIAFAIAPLDRLVHFLYGLLLFPISWELFAPHIDKRGLRVLLVATFLMSHAGIYEIIEWLAAAGFGGDLGVAYLGAQGDQWDAQKDMAMACPGTLLAVLIAYARERRPTA